MTTKLWILGALAAATALLALAGLVPLEFLLAVGASVPVVGMILDERTEFCDAVSVAAAAGTALVGDVIDLTKARAVGGGAPIYLVINVDTEIITGGVAGTIEFILASDAAAAIAVDGTATEHFVSRKFVTDDAGANDAALNAGGVPVVIQLPGEGAAYERYLGILVRTTTTTTTAGKINAFLTTSVKQWKALDNGI